MDTAKKMYEYFLVEIRKERNTTVSPVMWTAYINPIVIDWIKTKLPLHEFSQKRIDDLEAIKILTDGKQYPYIPSLYDAGNIFTIPYSMEDYPEYFYGISAQFGILETEGIDPGDGDDPTAIEMEIDNPPAPLQTVLKLNSKVRGKILRSDQRARFEKNPYRKPDDINYVYFDNREGHIYVTSKSLTYNKMILEYYRYPKEIVYGEGIDEPGSFKATQNKEIIDIAIKRYLGRASDPRLQSQAALDAGIPK